MQFRSIKHAGKRKESSHLRSTMQFRGMRKFKKHQKALANHHAVG